MKHNIKKLYLIFLSILILWPCSYAQESVDQTGIKGIGDEDFQEIIMNVASAFSQGNDSLPSISLPAYCEEWQDDSTRAFCLAAARAYYDYRIKGFDHRNKVFTWQHFSTRIIFYVVLLLVFAGMCFSGIQFYKSIKYAPGEHEEAPDRPVTEFEASPKGIKISSPALGVIILVISLAFFYLYLAYVYPIKEIL